MKKAVFLLLRIFGALLGVVPIGYLLLQWVVVPAELISGCDQIPLNHGWTLFYYENCETPPAFILHAYALPEGLVGLALALVIPGLVLAAGSIWFDKDED